MGKDTVILDELVVKIGTLQSELEELTYLVDQLESSEDLKEGLALMASNISSEASDMMDLVDGYVEDVDEETEDFTAWLRTRDADGIISKLHESLHEVRQVELDRALNKLSDVSDRDKEEIEYLTERIVNKILNEPTQVVKKEMTKGTGYKHIDALKDLERVTGQPAEVHEARERYHLAVSDDKVTSEPAMRMGGVLCREP